MERINIEYDRLKQLLDTCNLNELDSIDILLSHVKKYDLKLINQAFMNAQQKKWNTNKSQYEGINEYDNITKIANFDITTISDYAINPYELIFLKKLMKDAIKNINIDKNPLDLKIVSNIEEAIKNINSSLNGLIDLSYMISDDELENMFNKFDATEIEKFDHIFEFVETYNIEKMMDISKKVHDEKVKSSSESSIEIYDFDISELETKKDKLSETELQLLCDILKDAIPGLMSYKEELDTEDDKYNNLEKSLFSLLISYEEEKDNRNTKGYTKVLKFGK